MLLICSFFSETLYAIISYSKIKLVGTCFENMLINKVNNMFISGLMTKVDNNKISVKSLRLVAGLGVEGDAKAKGGERQLLLCDANSFAAFSQNGKALCARRFMPNVLTEGIKWAEIAEGTRMQLGSSAIIEITSTFKKCFPPDCEQLATGETCEIKHATASAKILQSGEIKESDSITVI